MRLIRPAVDDVRRLAAKDPQIVRRVLVKLLLLEREPHAGSPLLDRLVGWRKLTVGDRDWRIVWRVGVDAVGGIEITVAEVWAVGARADDEIYEEMRRRVAELPDAPHSVTLADVVALLGRHVDRPELAASTEPIDDPVPPWLRQRLLHTARLSDAEISTMTGAQAMARWEEHISSPGD